MNAFGDAMNTTKLLTAEQFWASPRHIGKAELIRGELYEAAPGGFDHGRFGSEILVRLSQHAKRNKLGLVVGADVGFVLHRNPDTVRAPDAAFVRQDRVPTTGSEKFFEGSPDLAVEVMSPSDSVYEIEERVAEYLSAGTVLMWVVSPRAKTITVHRRGGGVVVLGADDTLSGEDVLAGFACLVREIFDYDGVFE